ncbi:putative beta-lactamase [Calothrix sp. NIES-4071]|nr:putative beta-lactamase [Calothrix sp. NIES-4071]BAZ59722.1 putative beta-lactamase [Calothrix sp. NIES-4105]
MKKVSRLAIILLAALVYFTTVQVQLAFSKPSFPLQSQRGEGAQKINFGRHFQELGVEGSILIYDLKANRTYQHNPTRNATSFLPASTFKILNSLISLETRVIADEVAVLTWDGIKRDIKEWNRDLNMREAFKLSAVWFYQVLARRVGHERMQDFVTKVGYGNKKIGGEKDIDKFWLEGELRITPQEQIQFISRLYNEDLPFSKRTFSIVKDIMIVEQTPDYTIRAKTGLAQGTPQIGWYVGYLEKNKNVYYFAVNIDIRKDKDVAARKELMRRCFKELRVL